MSLPSQVASSPPPYVVDLALRELKPAIQNARAHRRYRHFIKGPIPLSWMSRACQLPGHALHVALCLWYLCGLTRSRTVTLGNRVLRDFHVDRHAKYRALGALERAGLVRVTQARGALPRVEILDSPEQTGD